MSIIKEETVKKNKSMKDYFEMLVSKAKIIEEKTKGKEIDFIYNSCDIESFIFNGKLHIIN